MSTHLQTLELHEILQNAKLGIVSAHPDDHIPQANLLWELRENYPGITIDEQVFTRGRGGSNFRPHQPDFVTGGKRIEEGQASARHFGIKSYTQLDYEDGSLQGQEEVMATEIAQWALDCGITTFITLTTGDHSDHTAVAKATRMAATTLNQGGHEVSILELLPLKVDPGLVSEIPVESILAINATAKSTELALGAAACNPSQFEISQDPSDEHKKAWITYHGFYTEAKTLDRLLQYPIAETATYRYWSAQELGKIAVAPYATSV